MNEELEFDPAQRHLCPDGACTGLVGADGRCAVCGLDGGPSPERNAAPGSGDRESRSVAEAPRSASGSAAEGADGGFDAGRKLCDDGSCVGVIGPDGRCGVCGRVSGS